MAAKATSSSSFDRPRHRGPVKGSASDVANRADMDRRCRGVVAVDGCPSHRCRSEAGRACSGGRHREPWRELQQPRSRRGSSGWRQREPWRELQRRRRRRWQVGAVAFRLLWDARPELPLEGHGARRPERRRRRLLRRRHYPYQMV